MKAIVRFAQVPTSISPKWPAYRMYAQHAPVLLMMLHGVVREPVCRSLCPANEADKLISQCTNRISLGT